MAFEFQGESAGMMAPGAWVRSAISLGLVLAALLAGPGWSRADDPEWAPDQALLGRLAPEEAFDGLAIRPPTGARTKHAQVGPENRHVWGLEPAGKPAGVVGVTQVQAPAGGDMERGLQVVVDRLKTRVTNMQSGAIETGTINGARFVRVRYRADEFPGLPFRPVYGFVYATQVPDRLVQITGFGDEQTIGLLEASAQTFRVAR